MAVLLAAGGVAGWYGGSAAPVPSPPPASRFSQNGVTVALSVADWKDGSGTLRATFTPEQAGFHLYSVDLPPDGIDGVGRPTSVQVTGALEAVGAPRVSVPVRPLVLPGDASALPVYPDGPVTVSITVRTTANGRGEATVLVGYAACSVTAGCLFPVTGHPVAVRVGTTGAVFPTEPPSPAPTTPSP
ncbi:hypothetical protein [Kitasatospora nipponensis]|uniref:hypothetical protein n=1 Tax=Kitasatospora nipponensis TaxID=258049 RepID=UPI0031D1468F